MKNEMTLGQKLRYGAIVLASTGAAVVQAAPIDVEDLVTDIGAQIAPIVLVGGAVLLVVVAVKAFRWVRSALS